MPEPTLLPPRVKITCHVCGAITRTRNPAGATMPCVPCSQHDGRTTMLTVPSGPGNALPTIRPEPPANPNGVAQVLRRRTGPAQVQCSGCHATVDLSSPPVEGQPAGWVALIAGTPDGPRPGELLARCCSAECVAVILPEVKSRLAELPYQPPDRQSSASTVAQLMREVPCAAR